jgi:hypothetical protein
MTLNVVENSVSVNVDVRPFWKDREKRSHASELLHQQLYVLGRDIECKHGNLLVHYGAKKKCSPDGCAVSLYSFRLHGGYRLALRGFGVFVGLNRIGGLFLYRYQIEPRWMPSATFEPIAWLPNQMPRTHKVRDSESGAALELVNEVFHFFRDYESWIRDQFGKHYRIGQLTAFQRLGNNTVHWDTLKAWETLC